MEKRFDLLLVGGTVVTGAGMRRADVGVRDGLVAAIEPDLYPPSVPPTGGEAGSSPSRLRDNPSIPPFGGEAGGESCEVLDVTGRYVLPGIIDVHVHPVYLDNVEDCSRVAAFGGTTTLLHFAYARTGDGLLQKVEEMLEDGLTNSLLDFGLHGGMFEAAKQIPEIPKVMELGVRTYKFFMPYIKQGWYTDDYQLIKAMDLLVERGGMAMVHAENGGGIDYLEDKYLTGPDASASRFNLTRPATLEEEAVNRAIRLAEVVGCPLYIPHVTAARALRPIRQAQADGLPVYAESCPQYLTLTQEIIETRGALAKIGPPIRTAADRAALWEALADGTLHTVASDHAPKHKDVNGDFLEQPFGSPQIETLLPLTYDGGVSQGRVSTVRLVQVLCENPARIFGLYPQKGTISVGSDADLVIFNPNRPFTIRAENQHSNAGYTLYEGHTVLGWPERSFQRGRPILRDGEVVAERGEARFLATMVQPVEPLRPPASPPQSPPLLPPPVGGD
jgi:dihydropyrimidinase